MTGIYINAEGPSHIHDVTFKGFGGNDADVVYCGIEFKDKFDQGMGASSSVKGKYKFLKIIFKSIYITSVFINRRILFLF